MTIQKARALADSALANLKRSGETSLSFRIEYNREIPDKEKYITYKKQQADREVSYAILLLQRQINEQIVLFSSCWTTVENRRSLDQSFFDNEMIVEQLTIHVKTLVQVLRILSG